MPDLITLIIHRSWSVGVLQIEGQSFIKVPVIFKKSPLERVCWIILPATMALNPCHRVSSFQISHFHPLPTPNSSRTRWHLAPCVGQSCQQLRRARPGASLGASQELRSHSEYTLFPTSLVSFSFFFFQETDYYHIKNYPPRENSDHYWTFLIIPVLKTRQKFSSVQWKCGFGMRHSGLLVWFLAHCCWSEVFLLLQLYKTTLSHSGNVSIQI